MVSEYFRRLSFKLIIVLISVKVVSSDIYSSLAQIQDELSKRRQDSSISEIKRLLDTQEQRLVGIRRIVQTLEDFGSGVRDPKFTVNHPLDAYRFIKNHSVIYNETVTDLLAEIQLYKNDQEDIENITQLLISLPSEDLKGTLKGLLRIQAVYNLKTQDIADGNIRNFTTRRMTAAECTDMMAIAYNNLELYHLGLDWINMALTRMAEGDRTSSYSKILAKGAAVTFKTGYETQALAMYEQLYNLNPKNRYYKYKLKYYKRNAPDKSMVFKFRNLKSDEACQGISQKKTKTTDGRLLCHYLDNGHPILRYQPAKLEVLSLDPYISIYHDCVHKALATAIKNQAIPHLVRSETTDGTIYLASDLRTSKGTHFGISAGYVPKLYRYIEALTSLKWKEKNSYSLLQVSNYGIGGHYDIHHDFLFNSPTAESPLNDRLATFLIYLSDVEEGGATAFPLIGESVRPEAGSALFWYNLYPNGNGNEQTLHKSCPVIVGDKWIVTLLMLRNGQEFTRPCNLEENDTRWKL